MEELWQGFLKALELIAFRDPEVIAVTGRSLAISATSCGLATAISIPLGSLIHFSRFRGKTALVSVIQTLYSLPTVVVGLLVFVLFSRAGPLGELNIIFTPAVMVTGQVILIIPLMLGLVISALSGIDKAYFSRHLAYLLHFHPA
ncbi:ABC transporter permease, partial [Chloroflexota bacterium]